MKWNWNVAGIETEQNNLWATGERENMKRAHGYKSKPKKRKGLDIAQRIQFHPVREEISCWKPRKWVWKAPGYEASQSCLVSREHASAQAPSVASVAGDAITSKWPLKC